MSEIGLTDNCVKLSRRSFLRKNSLKIFAAGMFSSNLNGLIAAARDKSKSTSGSKRYLLVDRRLIANTQNLKFTVRPGEKSSSNPLFVEDRPWEVRYDNMYPNVDYDADRRLFRCWYSPFIVDDVTSNTSAERRKTIAYKPAHREVGICYAESIDGVIWQKPDLGLTEFKGTRTNNIVLRGLHGGGVFRDVYESDSTRRFKAIGKTSEIDHSLSVAFSPDGLRWSKSVRCTGVTDNTNQLAFDTHNNAFWSRQLQKYVCITRLWRDGQRVVGRCESDDFINWSLCKEIIRADQFNQSYAMPVFEHADNYFGLLMLLNTKDDRVRCELTWSPDTVNWHRVDEGQSIIENSNVSKEYDWGCIYAGLSPVIFEDTIRFYYSGSDDTHGSWRKSCLALATTPADRIAGCEPADSNKAAEVILGPITYQGDGLKITADIIGTVSINVLADNGTVIANSEPMTGNVTDKPVALRANLESTIGKVVRIKFMLDHAKLYSCCI